MQRPKNRQNEITHETFSEACLVRKIQLIIGEGKLSKGLELLLEIAVLTANEQFVLVYKTAGSKLQRLLLAQPLFLRLSLT